MLLGCLNWRQSWGATIYTNTQLIYTLKLEGIWARNLQAANSSKQTNRNLLVRFLDVLIALSLDTITTIPHNSRLFTIRVVVYSKKQQLEREKRKKWNEYYQRQQKQQQWAWTNKTRQFVTWLSCDDVKVSFAPEHIEVLRCWRWTRRVRDEFIVHRWVA